MEGQVYSIDVAIEKESLVGIEGETSNQIAEVSGGRILGWADKLTGDLPSDGLIAFGAD